MKFPIGIQSFEKMITEGYCYVDKTDLLYQLVKEGGFISSAVPAGSGKACLYLP